MHSGPYTYIVSLKSKIRIAVIDDGFIKVIDKYPGFPRVVTFPKSNYYS